MIEIKLPVIFFEPSGVRRLGPPIATRPIWELRVGPVTIGEILTCGLDDEPEVAFWAREELTMLCPRPLPELFEEESVLLVAGHHLPFDYSWWRDLERLKPGEEITTGAETLALCLDGASARSFLEALDHDAEIAPPQSAPLDGPYGPIVRYWWELHELAYRCLDWQLAARMEILEAQGIRLDTDGIPGCDGWISRENIFLHETARIDPTLHLDAAAGPIMIGAEVQVGAGSYIKGPCYLGPRTQVKPLSQLMGHVFCGPECRLAGEIANTQFQGHANKGHHGFLGHAFVGEWVNLGAGTTNSNLKNTYSDNIRVEYDGRSIDTRRTFLGCCLGDHVKVGIQGRLNTGTVLGVFSNWFGAAFPPKWLPPFSWGDDGGVTIHRRDDALATAARVMDRRGCAPDPELIALYKEIFKRERESRGQF